MRNGGTSEAMSQGSWNEGRAGWRTQYYSFNVNIEGILNSLNVITQLHGVKSDLGALIDRQAPFRLVSSSSSLQSFVHIIPAMPQRPCDDHPQGFYSRQSEASKIIRR